MRIGRKVVARMRVAAATVVATSGLVIAAPEQASAAAPTVGLVYLMLNDGTPSFDATAGPGNDTGAHNGITRNQDTVGIRWGINVNGASSTSTMLSQTLPVGMVWDLGSSPSQCAIVTYADDNRTIHCDLGPITAGTAFDMTATARVSGSNPDGTLLVMPSPTFSATNADGTSTATPQPDLQTTSSGRPKLDLRKDANGPYQTYAAGPNGEPGVVSSYAISLEVIGGGKGSEALAGNDIKIIDTFTEYVPGTGTSATANGTPNPLQNGTLYTWGARSGNPANPESTWGLGAGNPTDGCYWNGEGAVALGAHFYSTLPYGKVGSVYSYDHTNGYNPQRSTGDSGDWQCTQAGPGQPINLTIHNADTSGDQRPTLAGYPYANYALPSDTTIIAAGIIQVWYPISDFTVTTGNYAWQLDVRNRVEFDPANPPVGISGTPNVEPHNVAPGSGQNAGPNPGDPWYGTNDNNRLHTLVGADGSFDKGYLAGEVTHPSYVGEGWWYLVPGASNWRSGDAYVAPGQDFSSAARFYNSGFLDREVTLCDYFDNTWQQIRPLGYTVPSGSYGTGTQGAFLSSLYYFGRPVPAGDIVQLPQYSAYPSPDLESLRSTNCSDDYGPWYDNLDDVPGGAAAVTHVRATMVVKPAQYGSLRVSLMAKANAPDEALMTNFGSFTDSYSAPSYSSTGGWWRPDYTPAADGTGTGITGKPWNTLGYITDPTFPLPLGTGGDRLRVARALARVNKKTVNAAGTADDSVSSVRASNTVTYQLAPSFTSYLPAPPTAEHYYVYDILDRWVTYVSGSSVANPNSPAISQPTVIASTDPVTGDPITVLRWDLGQRTANQPLPTLTYSVRTKATAPGGTVTGNSVIVDAVDAAGDPLDGSACLPSGEWTVSGSHDLDWALPSTTQLAQTSDSQCARGWSRNVTINQVSSLTVGKEAIDLNIQRDGTLHYRVTYANVQPTPTLSNVEVIDALPEVGDGRTPANDWVGTAYLAGPVSLVDSHLVTAGAQTIRYTMAPKATVRSIMETNPAVPLPITTVQWCLESELGVTVGCPTQWSDVTGWRLSEPGPMVNGAYGTVEFSLVTKDNRAGDIYTNRATASAFEVSLPVASPDVSIPVVGGTISDFVWEDLNGDGTQDAGEPAVGGATVRLFEADGTTPVQIWDTAGGDGIRGTADDTYVDYVTTTDPTGLYSFTGLKSGDYRVMFTPPAGGYVGTLVRVGADTAVDSNPDRLGLTDDYLTPVVHLACRDVAGADISPACDTTQMTSVDDDPTIDAGFVRPVSIGNYVWEDVNGDGVQGPAATEPPVAGAVATLYVDADNDPATVDWIPVTVDINNLPISNTDTTGSDGLYLFSNLRPAIYQVRFTAPSGYLVTTPTASSATDSTDSDGVSPAGDPTTATTAGRLVPSAANDMNLDLGLYRPVSIGDLVWYDANGDGIQGAPATETPVSGAIVTLWRDLDGNPATTGDQVQVTLDAYGNPVGDGAADGSYTTGSDGLYLFDDLPPGTYQVRFVNTDPTLGFTQVDVSTTTDALDSDAVASSLTDASSGWYTLVSNAANMTVDAGLTVPASLGDLVWLDYDGDGQQDGGALEPGIDGATVALELWDPVAGTWLTSFTDIYGAPYVTSQTTAGGGLYLFDDLIPGRYRVQVTPPAGYFVTNQNAGADATDSDIDAATLYSGAYDVAGGQSDLTVDAGLYMVPSVGDLVWEDLDRDGVQDAGEPGISGVLVELVDANGTVVASTTTAADGTWFIDRLGADQTATGAAELHPGVYTVRFATPPGMELTASGSATPDTTTTNSDPTFTTLSAANYTTSSFLLGSDQHEFDIDAGFYTPVSIGDLVWQDTNNDGLQGAVATEPSVAGAQVTLWRTTDGGTTWTQVTADIYGAAFGTAGTITTGADGLYLFDNLEAGTYQVRFTAPAGFDLTSANVAGTEATDSDAVPTTPTTGSSLPVTLVSGDANVDVDAGVWEPVSIGDYVWTDSNGDGQQGAPASEPPVAGAQVTLWRTTDGGSTWTQVTADVDGATFGTAGTITTGADGGYLFDNLPPGTYRVQFDVPPASDLVLTASNVGADTSDSDAAPTNLGRTSGVTQSVTLASGQSDLTLDAGMVVLASIGDLVWLDVNGDGQQGDPLVETPVAGAQVTLWSSTDGGSTWTQVTTDFFGGTFGTAGTITTGGDGQYLFGNLLPGLYQVRFTPPTGMSFTQADAGADSSDSDANRLSGIAPATTLSGGENDLSVDAGVYVPLSVGDLVWNDLDADGIQDAGEAGISDVFVELIDADGNVVGSTTTDATGLWNIAKIGSDQSDPTAMPILPGTYTVRFTSPTGMAPTVTDGGAADTTADDSDGVFASPSAATGTTPAFDLSSGEHEPDLDQGFFTPVSVGDLVWQDTNGDGVQGPVASEPAVAGAQVTLWRTADGGTTWTQVTADIDGVTFGSAGTITTGADGLYLFDNLQPGTYQVRFTAPAGFVLTGADSVLGTEATDSDAVRTSPSAGSTAAFTLVSGDARTDLDAGVFEPVTIGDYVWEDVNGDGQQGAPASEPPVAGAQVTLWRDADGDPATVDWVQVTADQYGNPIGVAGVVTTGVDGGYLFADVAPGTYEVRFTAPAGMVLTEPVLGGLVATDSDPVADDPAVKTTGTTAAFFVPSGTDDLTLDAGVIELASIGDLVWLDVNGDGQQGDPAVETPVAGAQVTLWTSTDGGSTWTQVTVDYLGNTIGTAGTITTGSDGLYLFDNLYPGLYQVRFVPPAGMELTDPTVGSATTDSDADLATGASAAITISSGDHRTDIDAGVYVPVSAGDLVWDDLNADGIQQAGEPGISGATVELLDAEGNVVASTVTGADGSWTIDRFGADQADPAARGLIPGTYSVRFTTPAGTVPTDQSGVVDTTTDNSDGVFGSLTSPTGTAGTFVLTSGENEPDVDQGFYTPVSIGDLVWVDTDGDGHQDAGELPVANAVVTLWRTTDGGTTWTHVTADIFGATFGNAGAITTTSDGLYLFDNLEPGSYQVRFTAPSGYVMTAPDLGADDGDSDALVSGPLATSGVTTTYTLVSGDADMTVDAGVFIPASIGNFVWEDMNRNGVQDAGERGVDNIPVILTGTDGAGNPVSLLTVTDSFGHYQFTDLVPGTYSVAIAPPVAFQPTLNGMGTAATDSDIDTTDSDPGPAQLFTTPSSVLDSGEHDVTWDAGLVKAPVISGHVWEDIDGDGVRDTSEPGIPGTQLTLTGTDSNGNPVSVTVTTDDTGYYLFPNIPPSDATGYTITETQPAGYADGQDTAGTLGGDTSVNDVISGIVLASSDVSLNNDFGEITLASLSGHVYVDNTNDGVFQAGEPPLDGVVVTLTGTDDLGNPVSLATTTDASGYYEFADLRPGTYTVTETQPSGYNDGIDTPGSLGGDATTNDVIAAIVLQSGDDSVNNDFGERPLVAPALTRVEGTVWLDPNRDGVRQAGENTGIAGVTITLLDSSGNVVATTVTDASGHYVFDGIAPGTYTITETQPGDYLSTSTDSLTSITVPAGGLTNQDFFEALGSLSGHVYLDVADDNALGGGDSPLGGVTVQLYDGSGNLVATTTTDASGYYEFTDLVPGDYRIVETQPAAYADDAETVGSLGGSAAVNDEFSAVTLAAGDQGTDYDFGEQPTPVPPGEATISGHVYIDEDHDADLTAGDTPLGGVTITLLDSTGTVVATTTTDPTGYYEFTGLVPGTYTIVETQPSTYTSTETPTNQITTTVAAGESSVNNDFGEELPPGVEVHTSVSGTVWVDTDGDGVKDPGEPGIPGVVVTLYDATGNVVAVTVTDAGGNYQFTGIAPGDYTITETQPNGYSNSPGTPAVTRPITVPIEGLTGQDFGEQLGLIDGFVYVDANDNGVMDAGEAPIGGVTVTLTGTDADGEPVSVTTTTDATGHYEFPGLLGGTYTVTETQPAGYTDGKETAGSLGGDLTINDVISAITLPAGGQSLGNDFGERRTDPPSNPGSVWIGGTVYLDVDRDGGITAGDQVLAGVTVELLDASGAVIATTTTAADGSYVFTGLTPGANYSVREVQPAGLGNGETPGNLIPVTAPMSGGTGGLDFGETLATVSGHVWNDVNDNGVVDAGEAGIGGVTVTLTGTDANGNPVSLTTTTDASGYYEFTGLVGSDAAGYTITETQPSGYNDGTDVPGSLGGDATVDDVISAVVLPGGGQSTDNDFGELMRDPETPVGTVWVGGVVYLDADQDGTITAGDQPIPGVTVEIWDATGTTLIRSVTTGPDGSYVFIGLDPSTDYIIRETQPAGLGSSQAPTNEYSVTSPATGGTVGFDFGETLATVSGTVYADLNDNGVQDAGEPGIGGVTVTLTGTDADGNPVSLTTTTDATGAYEFTDLLASDATGYTITETQPAGYTDGSDSAGVLGGDTTVNDVISGIVVPAGGNGPDNDFGEIKVLPPSEPAQVWVGGVVYYDANRDGVIGTGDQPMAGVKLNIVDSNGAIVGTTITAADGSYVFVGLVPGAQYTIVEDQPVGYGSSETPTNSIPVTAPATGGTWGYDFGETLSSIAGIVYVDANDNGVQDPGEPGISGVTVTLTGTAADGTVVSTTVLTDAAGHYMFDGLESGNYTVTETQPAGYTDGQDTYVGTGLPSLITNDRHAAIELPTGTDADGYLFGEIKVPTVTTFITGTVYYDSGANGYSPDGIRQPGEVGIGGVTVVLFDADGNIVAQTTTLADGTYRFDGIVPGDYTVVELQPSGYGTSTPNTVAVSVPLTGVSNVDFGETRGATTGVVYSDMSGNGVQDPGEPGIGGVTITLTGTDDRGNPVTVTTTSNPDGTWAITNLPPSDSNGYTITETQPAGWLDGSDASSVNGTIGNDTVSHVMIGAGQVVDSGHFGEIAPVTIGDFVWEDVNANGRQDAGEPGIANVTVTLTGTNDLGQSVSMTVTTGAAGGYLFEGLRPGTYTVTITTPNGMALTFPGLGDAAGNSDPTNGCGCVTLSVTGNASLTDTSHNRLDIDAGYYVPVLIIGDVWNDNNNNGIYDTGDTPRVNQVVTIVGAGPDGVFGTPDDLPSVTVRTDGTGHYELPNVPPGTYTVTTAGRDPITVNVPPRSIGRADFPYPSQIDGGSLPRTGLAIGGLLAAGLLAFGAGTFLRGAARRRRRVA